MTAAAPVAANLAQKAERLVSLDAYRGFVMLAMVSDGLGLSSVAEHFNDSVFWRVVDYHVGHVQWVGCAFWDLIQPSFTFMVGVAMPYSHASRLAKGQSGAKIGFHVIYRALLLIWLGVFLRSDGAPMTRWTFEDTLSQIGLGYALVYLLIGRGWKAQVSALTVILVGYWLAFALHPLRPADFDTTTVGVPKDWGSAFTGFFAHWNKNTNFASDFDVWFLNLFTWKDGPWKFNGGGYQTLNFVPTMGTMIFGLMAGEYLRATNDHKLKTLRLLQAGVILLVLGWIAGQTVCPLVKRIWTPSWTIFSSGWTFVLLGLFYGSIDFLGYKKWAFPLVVVGMNSIAMYVMVHLWEGWIEATLKTHLGQGIFDGVYGPLLAQSSVVAILWLICYWMYQKKLFIRI